MSNGEQAGRLDLPEHTTPTWEMELLVSGATIFGLLQLPSLLDLAYFKALNLSPPDYARLLLPLWIYSKATVITLAITFIAHLLLRGYWVALVGMDSVYPGGIRWDKLRMGPIEKADGARHSGTMPAIIERADNRATRVFAIGFGIAMILLMLPLAMLLALACCLLFDALVEPGHALEVFASVVAIALMPWALARILDRRIADRLPPGQGLQRLIGGVLAFYSRLGIGRGSNKLVALFVSHEGGARAGVVGLLIILPVLALLMVQLEIAKGWLPPAFFVGLSTDDPTSPNASLAAFYEDSRQSRIAPVPLPHVSARVVQGPYLELFIPFLPRLHGPAMAASCPQALRAKPESAASTDRLACLAVLSDIRIDGVPLAVRLDASNDPDSGQPGMLAMLRVAALAPGRHELSLNEAPRDRRESGRRMRRYRIPFWK